MIFWGPSQSWTFCDSLILFSQCRTGSGVHGQEEWNWGAGGSPWLARWTLDGLSIPGSLCQGPSPGWQHWQLLVASEQLGVCHCFYWWHCCSELWDKCCVHTLGEGPSTLARNSVDDLKRTVLTYLTLFSNISSSSTRSTAVNMLLSMV